VFSVYRTNGKLARVIVSRRFTEHEEYFYQRRLNHALAGS
jgi:hypothetical protein